MVYGAQSLGMKSKNKKKQFDAAEWKVWKPKVAIMASTIESCLEGFGVKAKVMEITLEDDHVLLKLSIGLGVRLEDVESLSRTLALSLASPTGSIKMIAPIPGSSYIGVRVPKMGKQIHETNNT